MRQGIWVAVPLVVLASCGGSRTTEPQAMTLGSTGAATSADGGESGSGTVDPDGGSESGGGSGEVCDGFDNDGDGAVDEGCTCTHGEVQDCFAGPPEAAIACRGTTQECISSDSIEQPPTWGECGGLCDGSTLTLDDPTMLFIVGAEAGDQFTLAASAGFADINGDGELDFVGASAYGDGLDVDVGAGYGLYGGPCLQRTTIDLLAMALSGTPNDDGIGGFVVDDASGEGQRPQGLVSDVDGDGFGDAVVVDSASTVALVYGAPEMSAVYDTAAPNGAWTALLTGGGGTGGWYEGLAAVDFDADGLDDIFFSAENYGNPTCPCGSQGIDTWWGRSPFDAQTPLDTTIPIGIGTVGQASQHNFTIVGGGGDFNNDGFLDVTGGNGAANDTMVINYRAFVFFGNDARLLPGAMTSVDGSNGFLLSGGSGRGPFPNHQQGDFNGDGVDDLVAYGNIPYSTALELDIVFGGGPFAGALTVEELGPGVGLTLTSTSDLVAGGLHMGVGDLDADGFDDLAVGVADTDTGGVLIIWGRAAAGGHVDVDLDAEVTTIAGAAGLGRTDHLAIADIDGDGMADLLVGAPLADTQNGEDSGAGMIKFGSCLAPEHNPTLVRGHDGDDTLVGGAQRDTIAAGRGNDSIEGGGGPDALYGGQGDDRFVVPDLEFARIHGGLGTDTLVLAAAGTLDLRSIGRARLQEVERFELGNGVQTLAMNAGDVTGLSGSSTRIEVVGDAADTVILEGPWISTGDGEYTHGHLTVAVQAPVVVQIQ